MMRINIRSPEKTYMLYNKAKPCINHILLNIIPHELMSLVGTIKKKL